MKSGIIRIVRWQEQFEVSEKQRAWRAGDRMQAGALKYLRIPVSGQSWSHEYRTLLDAAGPDAAAVYGIYVKLAELAAQWPADERGFVWLRKGIPATAEDVASLTGFSLADVMTALQVLSNERVGWIEVDRGDYRDTEQLLPGIAEGDTEPENEPQDEKSHPSIPSFQTTGGKATWSPTAESVRELIREWSTLDVLTQLDDLRVWMLYNRDKRCTPSGMKRRIYNWFTNAVDPGFKARPKREPKTNQERFTRYRRLLLDWTQDAVIHAFMTGSEWEAREKKRIRREESAEEQRGIAAQSRSRTSPESIGDIGEPTKQIHPLSSIKTGQKRGVTETTKEGDPED